MQPTRSCRASINIRRIGSGRKRSVAEGLLAVCVRVCVCVVPSPCAAGALSASSSSGIMLRCRAKAFSAMISTTPSRLMLMLMGDDCRGATHNEDRGEEGAIVWGLARSQGGLCGVWADLDLCGREEVAALAEQRHGDGV